MDGGLLCVNGASGGQEGAADDGAQGERPG